MKTLILNLAILATICLYSSCELFEKAKNVSFDTEAELYFIVNESDSNPTGKSYSSEEFLDISTDPDVVEYSSKIKEIKVNKVTYYVYALTESGINFSAGSLVTKSNNKTIATLTNLTLTEGVTGEFSIDPSGFSDLGARLKANKNETIKLQGNLSETPVSFVVMCVFHITITADAL